MRTEYSASGFISAIILYGLNISLNICLLMTAKTITIREDIYKMLLSMKGTNESFSDFFERLVKSRNIDKLKELRGSIEFIKKEALLVELSEKRKEIGIDSC
jgi:predicted CopG family antitoxin